MFAVWKFDRTTTPTVSWETKYAAESAQTGTADDYGRQEFVLTALRHLPSGARVLDAGCGTGGLLGFLERRGLVVAGVDTSSTAIGIAMRAVPRADLRVASIEALPFPDATFDAYLAIGSWEYQEAGPDAAAREAARVLKSGGLVFVEVPHANISRRLFYIPLKQLEKGVRHLFAFARFSHHLFRVREMHDALRHAGFEILETHPHDLPEPTRHYGLSVDWPLFRGGPQYELNALGRLVKWAGNVLSPWTIATGMFIVARKT